MGLGNELLEDAKSKAKDRECQMSGSHPASIARHVPYFPILQRCGRCVPLGDFEA